MANLLKGSISGDSRQYVYYEWLKDAADLGRANGYFDDYISKGENILSNINMTHGKGSLGEVSARIYAQAGKEIASELSLLSQVFGVALPVQYDPNNKEQTSQFFKELITAFNETLNLKKNFERNVDRIKMDLRETNTEGKLQINVASFFDTYFGKAWENRAGYRQGKMMNDIRSAFLNGMPIEEAIDKYFSTELDETITLAIQYMFESDRRGGTTDEEKDYQQLLDILDTFQGKNELIQGLKQAYQLDQIKDEIKKALSVSQKQKKISYKDLPKSKIQNMVSTNRYSRGGLALEYFENFIANAILSGTIQNGDFQISMSGSAHHTGDTGMKADNIITFNINPQIIEDMVKDLGTDATNRTNIVNKITKMEEQLQNVKDGFIIYSSAKNYTRQDKDFKGFSGGADITLGKFESLTNDSDLAAAIRQLLKGAMGENGSTFEEVKTAMAEQLAYLLFDDFRMESGSSNLTKLHLFDLDGIYVPFSTLLYEVARSIEEVNHAPTSVMSVEIERGTIIHEKPENIGKYLREHFIGQHQQKWSEQASVANQEIKIGIHFFKNFFKFIQENF